MAIVGQKLEVIKLLKTLPSIKEYNFGGVPLMTGRMIEEIISDSELGRSIVKSVIDLQFKRYAEELVKPSKSATEEYERLTK